MGVPGWRRDGATIQLESELFIRETNIQGHLHGPGQTGTSGAAPSGGAIEQAPAWSVGLRMAPLHVKRKFWWELIFISVLIFLLAGVRSQRKREDVAAAQVTPAATLAPTVVALIPAADLGGVVTPLPLPLALQ
jgi:hypothetical protein